MDSIRQLISILEPHQRDFIPQNKFESNDLNNQIKPSETSHLINSLSNPLRIIILDWKQTHKFPDEEINRMEIQPVGRRNSLYASILSILHNQYNLTTSYNQKSEMIEIFVRFLIAKMELDTKIKLFMKNLRIKKNTLIDEIKNPHYQSDNVIYYLSLILDLNIIILGKSEIELYYSEEIYDSCKPHILLYRDMNQMYYPINYKKLNNNTNDQMQLLIYYDDSIIKKIVDNYNKKVINKKNYIKTISMQSQFKSEKVNYNSLLVTELRKISEAKGIDVRKVNPLTNKKIYKTKSELITEIETHCQQS